MLSTKEAEGLKLKSYDDSLGYKTIGYGHLLDGSKESRAPIEQLGLDYDSIKSGKTILNKQQADMIFAHDKEVADHAARMVAPWIDNAPNWVGDIVKDMSFQLGADKLSKFAPTLQRLAEGKYAEAASRLKSTSWFKQSGRRSQAIIQDLLDLGRS